MKRILGSFVVALSVVAGLVAQSPVVNPFSPPTHLTPGIPATGPGAGLVPVTPGSSDILNCNTTGGITTAPVAFATTWTMPAFTQTAGASFGVDFDLATTSSSSSPTIAIYADLDTTPIYASSAVALTASSTNLPSTGHMNITATAIGSSGAVVASAPAFLTMTSAIALNHAVAPTFLNGTFSSSATWTLGAGWSISGGFAVATGVTVGATITQPVAMVQGTAYTITYTVTNYSGSGTVSASLSGGVTGTLHSANGTYSDIVTAVISGSQVAGITGSSTLNASISNISITAATIAPAIDTTASHTVSLLMTCNATTAGNSVQLLAIRPVRIY